MTSIVRIIPVALVAMVLATAAACADDDGTQGPPVATPTPADSSTSPLALYGEPGTSNYNGDSSGISGVLRREGNCLYVESGSLATSLDGRIDGPHRTFLALHAGITEWDEDREMLTVAGREMALDEPVMFGGSGGDLSGIDWYIPPAPECDADTGWIAGDTSDPVLQAGWLVREYGYGEAESVELHFALIEAGRVVAELQVLVADRLGGAWPVYGPEAKAVVWLTGDEGPSAEAEALAATSPISVDFRTGATYTVRELGRASLAIREKLADAGWFQGAQIESRENAVMAFMDGSSMDESPEQMAAALSTEFGVRVVAYVDEPPDHDILTPDGAVRADAQWYAEAEGVTIEEAVRRLELQGPAGEHGAQLRDIAGDRYAGDWLQHQPDYRLVFWLAGDEPAPRDLLALAESGPIPVTIKVGADYTFSELRAAQERLPTVIDEEIANGLDLKANAVTVYLFREITDAELEALAADLSKQLGVRVVVEPTQPPSLD